MRGDITEFLLTYGWAILAGIIAIGVLVYFGIFNPADSSNNSNNTPENFCNSLNMSFYLGGMGQSVSCLNTNGSYAEKIPILYHKDKYYLEVKNGKT